MDTDRDLFELNDDQLFGKDCVGWVIVTSHAQHFIGKLVGVHNIDGDEVLESALDTLSALEPVTLYPAFEFAPLMVPSQKGISRQPFVSTPHFTLEPLKVRVRPTSYYLLADMKEPDQKTYKGFVKTAITQAKEQRLARVGLVAPNTDDVRRTVGARGA